MKTYGENRKDSDYDKFTTLQGVAGWVHQGTRNIAKRKMEDKKILHRRERRGYNELCRTL